MHFRFSVNSRYIIAETRHERLLAEIRQLDLPADLPKPTRYFDKGNSAIVFETTNPDVLLRAGPEHRECETKQAKEAIQKTGGVAKVFGMEKRELDGHPYVLTWKEKLNTNVAAFLLKNYRSRYEEIANALALFPAPKEKALRVLERFPPTSGLAKAIRLGLPTADLDLETNLGVTEDGRIVAFDC